MAQTTANTAADPEIKGYDQQLATLDNELAHWTSLKNQYYNDYICQLYGGPTCPKKGYGPAAKDSQQNYNAASQEVDTLKAQINQVQGEIQQRDAQLTSTSKSAQQARYEQALAQQPIVKNEYDTALQRQNELQASFFASNQAAHGILIRLEALSELSNGNFTVTAARFLLFLLFLVIECLPVTVKLLQQPGLYEEALRQAREAERRDASKFFNFRSRLTGPNGTAVLRPTLRLEPDSRVDAIWKSTRALPGSVVSEDDRPTEAVNDPGASWDSGEASSLASGEPPSWTPGGRADYGPTGSRAGSDRPGQRWYGADRWRNHWQEQSAEDDEPQAEDDEPPGRSDSPGRVSHGRGRSGSRCRGNRAGLRSDGLGAPGRRLARAMTKRRCTPATDSGSTITGTRTSRTGARARTPGTTTRSAVHPAGGQAATVPPGNGGTPLKWDEDE